MKRRNWYTYLSLRMFLIALYLMLIQGCSDDLSVIGVNSPEAGVLLIKIKSDDADNYLVVAGDTVMVREENDDSLAVHIGQGRAYRGADYAILYKGLDEYRERTKTYNLIRMSNGEFEESVIFESYLSPADYDSLKITITSDYLQIGFYNIPIKMPPGVSPLLKFDKGFRINESRITVIVLQLKPFSSLIRVRDAYEFFIAIEVVEIKYL